MTTDQTTSTVDLTVNDGKVLLTLPAEGKFNADTLAAVNGALDRVLDDAGATALIITGRDKHFSQGLDLEYLGRVEPDVAMGFVNDCMRMIARLLQFPLPTVAAINGHAFGLGFMIAVACDYRVMRSDRGFMCLPEVDLGMTLIPSMNALVTATLRGSLLRDLLLAGRRLGGSEAAERGLVDHSCPLEELLAAASALPEPMLGKPRETLAGLKADLHRPILAIIEAA